MTRPQIVINVHGGMVQDVFGSAPDVQVLVVDWDTDGLDNPASVELELDGRRQRAIVNEMPIAALEDLVGTDVEKAMDAACDQGILAE